MCVEIAFYQGIFNWPAYISVRLSHESQRQLPRDIFLRVIRILMGDHKAWQFHRTGNSTLQIVVDEQKDCRQSGGMGSRREYRQRLDCSTSSNNPKVACQSKVIDLFKALLNVCLPGNEESSKANIIRYRV